MIGHIRLSSRRRYCERLDRAVGRRGGVVKAEELICG